MRFFKSENEKELEKENQRLKEELEWHKLERFDISVEFDPKDAQCLNTLSDFRSKWQYLHDPTDNPREYGRMVLCRGKGVIRFIAKMTSDMEDEK